ncbi:MAG TPA: transposase [Pirellulales bacterium]|jgi:putative DNA methylase
MSHEKASPKGWYRRGVQHPPHFDGGAFPQFVTFRLQGTLPQEKLIAWRERLYNGLLSAEEFHSRIESYLDAGAGECWLRDERVASVVQESLQFFDNVRYIIHGWVVMPNHVHLLFTPMSGHSLAKIVGAWKSYSAKQANAVLGRSGAFWQDDYFDRYIRDLDHFEATLWYIAHNPVAAGLCGSSECWQFSHAGAH